MRDYLKFYIDGNWVDPAKAKSIDVINPATEKAAGRISMGSADDVDRAVKAARAAFASYSQTSVEERAALLDRVIAEYKKRYADMAAAITEEMGAPVALARDAQAAMGMAHLQTALAVLRKYAFQEQRGTTMLVKEPIGVCGFITPWNWPMNQIACKVAPALAVGCTMVLKPSEIAPFSAHVWAEIMHAAGVPAGVFNLVDGDGPSVGAALSSHHMLSSWYPVNTIENLRLNTLWDGIFHSATYVFVVVALYLFWKVAHRGHLYWSHKLMWGTALLGWGCFNLVEGIVDHQILGIHHVNERVEPDRRFAWDMGFLVWGAAMVVVGWLLMKAGQRERSNGRRLAPAA